MAQHLQSFILITFLFITESVYACAPLQPGASGGVETHIPLTPFLILLILYISFLYYAYRATFILNKLVKSFVIGLNVLLPTIYLFVSYLILTGPIEINPDCSKVASPLTNLQNGLALLSIAVFVVSVIYVFLVRRSKSVSTQQSQ